ncbi:putative ribonuclease H-like domain-containing protein [Tanacetum coccineum]
MNVSPIPTTRIDKDHPKDQIIGDLNSAIQTRRMTKISDEHAMVCYINKQRRTNHKDYQNCLFACFLSQMEPKKVIQALEDPSWIEAMQEELLQFQLQKVWTLVNLPNGKRAIGTKWVFRNKKDKRGIVVRNKARLVAQGYTLFLAYASFMGFIVYEMDVKAFLYGTIEEEVYVCQPPSFEDPQFPDKVYKVEKALYGLHQALRAWYETLSTYLIENGFRRGTIDNTLFIKKDKASTPMEPNKALVKDEEADSVDVHLYRSMIRSLRYLKGQPKLGLWYPRDSPFDSEAFSDSDYARASLDKKSTTGGCQFLGKRLISWQCKKQTIVANSTTEVEYVAAANYCGQVLWIQNQMLDYRFNFLNTKIFIDNERTICIVKNLVFHSKTKHIEIRHHFIRDCYEKKLIQFLNTSTSKIVNSVKQIHAIVDGKAVIISESLVRSDLLFNDEDGIACLTNDEIFENLALMGLMKQLLQLLLSKKEKLLLLFDSMLVQNQAPEGEGSAIPPEPQPTPSTSQPNVSEPQTESLQTKTPPTVSHELQTEAHIEQILPSPSTYQRKQRKTQKHRRAKQVTALPQTSVPLDHGAYAQTRPETASKMSRDPPLLEVNTSGCGEDSMEYHDNLMDFVPPTPYYSPFLGGSKDCSRQSGHQIEIEGQEARKEEKGKNFTTYKEKTTRVVVKKVCSTVDQVSTARPKVSAASVPVNVSVLVEEKPELAQRLHEEELAELDRALKERQKQEEATSVALAEEFDEIQVRIDVDHELAIRLTHADQQQAESTKRDQEQILREVPETET